MITPQQIDQVAFKKSSFGGYNMQQVDEFLEPLTEDYVTLYKENALLKSKLRVLAGKLEEYRKGEGAAKAQKIRNETDKEVSIRKAEAEKQAAELSGEGEAKYMEILADAYNTEEKASFYNYIRSVEAMKKSLSGSGDKTIILDKDSELARILYGDIR